MNHSEKIVEECARQLRKTGLIIERTTSQVIFTRQRNDHRPHLCIFVPRPPVVWADKKLVYDPEIDKGESELLKHLKDMGRSMSFPVHVVHTVEDLFPTINYEIRRDDRGVGGVTYNGKVPTL